MAIDVNGPFGNRQTAPYDAEVRRGVTNAEIRDMIDWCKDPEHPGHFRHRFDNQRQVMVFGFTDQNVAFQFKVRWG